MKAKLLLIIILALVLRIGASFIAHHGDLNNNISWGQELWNRGIQDYYGSSDANDWPYSAPNQPPAYILLFGGVTGLYGLLSTLIWWLNNSIGLFPSSIVWFWELRGMDLLVKLPSILADLGIGYLIYKYYSNKNKVKLGVTLAAVWLFNPVSWYNSAVWGQTDAIVNLIGMLGVLGLLGVFGELGKLGKLAWFMVWFTLSVLFKGSLLLFAPLLLVVAIKQRYSVGNWARAIIYSLVTIFLVSIWFHPSLDFPIWFTNLYAIRILPGEIGYLTANAFNAWWLVDSGKVLDSTSYFGIPARVIGGVGMVVGVVGVVYWLFRRKVQDKRVFFALCFVTLLSFLFMTRIHERYLYPFFPYGTLLLGLIPTFWIPYVVLSITYLLNMYHLFWAPSIPVLESTYQHSWPGIFLSLVNLVVFTYLLRLWKTAKL